MPPPMQRPTPPAQAPGGGGMSVQMGGGGPHSAPQGPPGGANPSEGIASIFAELEAAGVQIQPGPNGTVVLVGIPADILTMMGGGGDGGAPGGAPPMA